MSDAEALFLNYCVCFEHPNVVKDLFFCDGRQMPAWMERDRFGESLPLLRNCKQYDTINTCMDKTLSVEDGPKEVSDSSSPKSSVRQQEGPDGRSAWLVALSACAINFVMAGLQRMSGILFVAFIDAFGVDRRTASAPFSVKASTRNLLGPVVGILGQKYGVRNVCIMGGIVSSLGTVLCFFATDITWVTVLFGGLGGVGTALVVTLPQVVIGQHFDKYRTTAAGMAFSGGCVGAFIFPSLIDYLLKSYGLQGTLLVLGAVIAQTIPAAMILRKPSWLKSNVPKVIVSSVDENGEGNEVEGARVWQPNIAYLRKNAELVAKMVSAKVSMLEKDNKDMSINVLCVLEEMEDLYRSLQASKESSNFQQNLNMIAKDKTGEFFIQKEELCVKKSLLAVPASTFNPIGSLSKSKSVPDLSKLSLETPRESLMTNLKSLHCMKSPQIVSLFPEEQKRKVLKVSRELRKLYLARTKTKSIKITPKDPQKAALEKTQNASISKEESARKDGLLDLVKTAVRLHTKPLFLMICLCRCVHFITFLPVMTTIVDYVKDKGFQPEDGNYAIAALSLGDLVGRLCFGWVTDKGYLKISKYMLLVMILQGASTASLPMMHTRVALFVCLAVFGMLQGSLFVRHPVLVSMYMDRSEQSIAMGCVNFFSGLLGFGLPTYIGYFRDTLNSYDGIFYVNGALGAITGLMWLLEPYFVRCCDERQPTLTDATEQEESV
ncbi:hypothetical protein JTE90_027478 [Oedothorax gibbosus]|uniref:Monocarboxylate transporter n=1 Tax=Oedothorax gibbosus TaxID=931172 RepID=A0AAV6UFW5_9ARAC|nr:hypothetical protein JTE90_027478 [Oedothorax gibbosus]